TGVGSACAARSPPTKVAPPLGDAFTRSSLAGWCTSTPTRIRWTKSSPCTTATRSAKLRLTGERAGGGLERLELNLPAWATPPVQLPLVRLPRIMERSCLRLGRIRRMVGLLVGWLFSG